MADNFDGDSTTQDFEWEKRGEEEAMPTPGSFGNPPKTFGMKLIDIND